MDFLLKLTSAFSQSVMNHKEFGVDELQTHKCVQQLITTSSFPFQQNRLFHPASSSRAMDWREEQVKGGNRETTCDRLGLVCLGNLCCYGKKLGMLLS